MGSIKTDLKLLAMMLKCSISANERAANIIGFKPMFKDVEALEAAARLEVFTERVAPTPAAKFEIGAKLERVCFSLIGVALAAIIAFIAVALYAK